MLCSKCNTTNDPDALFCAECGAQLAQGSPGSRVKARRVYLYALLLLPVLALAAGIGYYKFFLPQGVAAVVNGERIMLPELEAAVFRTTGGRDAADARLRYAILNGLITERLVLQEARRAGMVIPREEITSAVDAARDASGLNDGQFSREIASQYGSVRNFEEALSRRLLVNKFIAEKVVPPNADARNAGAALGTWLQERSAAASVRVTLAEQWSGAGCGCCSNRAEASTGPQAGSGCRTVKGGCAMANQGSARSTDPLNAGKAADAALRYWHEKHGAGNVTTKVTDFGCHMQVDIIKDNIKIGSLRYQGGSISER
jgi:hypothetical protein